MNVTKTELTLAQRGKFLGAFRNEWRQRNVEIFEMAGDANSVVTVGRPFDETQDPVACIESRADYESTLQKIADAENNGKTYVYE